MVLFSLTLVRHGETEANRDSLIQGQSNFVLNQNGKEQARLLGRSLASAHQLFSHCFSSDLARAHETAELILEHHTEPVTLVLDSRLRERNLGIFENLPASLLQKAANDTGKKIMDYVPEGAESVSDVRARMANFFQDLCRMLQLEFPDKESGEHRESGMLPGGGPLLISSRQSSRHVSRSGNLNAWPEEEDRHPSFFVAEDSEESFIRPNHESYDSGIADEVPLSVDTEIDASADMDSTLRASGSSGSGWSLIGLSPRDTTSPTSPLPAGNGALSLRKVSMQSIGSDDSCFPDLDAQVLIVSHGGPIKELLRHFCKELGCLMPEGKGGAFSICPNTAVSTFMVSSEGENLSLTCLELHSTLHLGTTSEVLHGLQL